jgi:ABC-type cobalamin/Fe3+-siderophores transport system ATPase subunit
VTVSETGGSVSVTNPQPVEWNKFQRYWPARFKQGQHVTVIGPTGCGKTVLTGHLVEPRKLVVATGVKYVDESLDKMRKQGWKRVGRWKERPKNAERVLLWPNEPDVHKLQEVHRQAFNELLASVYKEGHWCIWSDELRYLTDMIGLKKVYQQMYIAGRSNRISLVSAAQRPSHVPLEAYSQAQHLFLFRTGDERDLTRMGGLNGVNSKQVAATVAELPKHHFLYVDLNDGTQYISTVKE